MTATSKSKANYIALTPRALFSLALSRCLLFSSCFFLQHHYHQPSKELRSIVKMSFLFSRRKLFRRRRTSFRFNADRSHQNECTSTQKFSSSSSNMCMCLSLSLSRFFQFPSWVITNVCRCLWIKNSSIDKRQRRNNNLVPFHKL